MYTHTQIINLLKKLNFVCMFCLHVYSLLTVYMSGAHGSQKKVLDPLELE